MRHAYITPTPAAEQPQITYSFQQKEVKSEKLPPSPVIRYVSRDLKRSLYVSAGIVSFNIAMYLLIENQIIPLRIFGL